MSEALGRAIASMRVERGMSRRDLVLDLLAYQREVASRAGQG